MQMFPLCEATALLLNGLSKETYGNKVKKRKNDNVKASLQE